MGAPRTAPAILDVLTAHRGLDVPIAAIMRETGLDKQQVQNAINGMIKRSNLPITVVVRAAVWRYEASNAASPEKVAPSEKVDTFFETVGRTKSGEAIVRGDATDTLYRVTALDF